MSAPEASGGFDVEKNAVLKLKAAASREVERRRLCYAGRPSGGKATAYLAGPVGPIIRATIGRECRPFRHLSPREDGPMNRIL